MFVVATSALFGWILTIAEMPQAFTKAVLSLSPNRAVTLLLINVLVLIAGCLLDTTAILLIIIHILLPVVNSFGIDPIHFGIVVVVGLAIGMVTPPVGLGLFVGVRAVGKVGFHGPPTAPAADPRHGGSAHTDHLCPVGGHILAAPYNEQMTLHEG